MKILVTAGPTREPLDPVRFLSNRSSGKMGYAVAYEAAARGNEVRLISGPVALEPPRRVERVDVTTAASMLSAVKAHLPWCDVLVMAAAVADWRPAEFSEHKLKKATMAAELQLERTPDILLSIRDLKEGRLYVAFAAETRNVAVEARAKLESKGVDLVVGNDVSRTDSGFEVDMNQVTLVSDEGTTELPLLTKRASAAHILDWIEKRWSIRDRH